MPSGYGVEQTVNNWPSALREWWQKTHACSDCSRNGMSKNSRRRKRQKRARRANIAGMNRPVGPAAEGVKYSVVLQEASRENETQKPRNIVSFVWAGVGIAGTLGSDIVIN